MRSILLAPIATGAMLLLMVLGYRVAHYGHATPFIFDDTFFFVRYAGNFLDTGVFAWNVGEGPVYGNTSQTYQLLITFLHWVTGRNIVLTIVLAATIGAMAYFVILPLAYMAWRPMIDSRLRLWVAALVLIWAALDRQIYVLIDTGMETTCALALVALSLLLTFRVENGHTRRGAIAVAALAILALFATRPDAALVAFAAPAGMVVFSSHREQRRHGFAICAVALGAIGGFMLVCWIYYGDALPLAFMTKMAGLTVWPQFGQDNAAYQSPFFLLQTLSFHKIEVLLTVGALVMFRRLSPAMRGVVLGTMAFAAYHVFLVLPIMGHFGRFTAPMVPVLVLLAARVIEEFLSYVLAERHSRFFSALRIAAGGGLALLIVYKVGSFAYHTTTALAAAQRFPPSINTSQTSMVYVANNMDFFEGRLDELVMALDRDCSVASSENGILSAFAARNYMIDFSGLHDPRLVREGFSADRLLLEQKPDILIMPPSWFDQWLASLEGHPALARDYVRETGKTIGGPWIAFRRESECAAKVRKALYGR